MGTLGPAIGGGLVGLLGAPVAIAENSNEMGYWQALTPDEFLGRVNATRRSVNRTMAALGALVAGLIVGLIGDRPALIGVVIAFTAAALTPALSPLRAAPSNDDPRPSGQRDGEAAARHQGPGAAA